MSDLLNITRTTFKVSDFLSWARRGGLNLRPPFQRGNVWSRKAKSFFIDSIVKGFPVPLIYLQDQTDPKTFEPIRLVVDGQQRLRTVLAYIDPTSINDFSVDDRFDVLKIHNAVIAGKPFRSVAPEVQQRVLGYEFSVHVLPTTTESSRVLEIFARMNATGVKLNEQEMRNAKFYGAFKQLAYELAYQELERWLRWKLLTNTQISRMKDAELTTELILFLLKGFLGKRQRALDNAYEDFDDEVPHADVVSKRVVKVLDVIDAVFSEGHAEMSFDKSPFNTQGWFYPLFAWLHDLSFAESVSKRPNRAPKRVSAVALGKHLTQKAASLASGSIDAGLLKSLRGAATDRRSRQSKYDFLSAGWRHG